MIERLLQRLALFARRRYYLIFVVVGLLLAISVVSALDLRLDTEILNLLPQDDPVVKTFRETLEEFGSLDVLLVLVRIPDGAALDPYFGFADELAVGLEALDEVEEVDYRIGELEELIESFFPQAFLFLDEEARRQVEDRLTEAGIRSRVAEMRRQLQTPQSLVLQSLYRLDPLGISEVFLDRLTSTRGALRVDWQQGYFLSADRQLLLLLARPVAPAQEVELGRRLIAAVESVVADVESRWQEVAGPDPPPLPVVELGGSHVIALQDATFVVRDVVVGLVTSMLGVLLLFLFALRRVGLLLYAFVPLSCGLILAFGFAAGAFGTLNAATSGFAALLVGLGIDFVIVSYGRYVEERRRGARLPRALRRMCGSSGRAVVTGAITTAATFYAFGVTEFDGLRQMGLLTGTGILFCMACVLVLLPAMLAWSEDHHQRREREVKFFLHGFGSGRLIRFCLHHPLPVLAVGAVLTLVAGLYAQRLEFVDSIKAMRPEGNRGVELQEEVADRFGSGFDQMMLVIAGRSEVEVLELVAKAEAGAAELVAAGELIGYDVVTSIVPPPARQRSALAWLAEKRQSVLEPGRVDTLFAAAAAAEGLRLEAFEGGLELLSRAASTSHPLELAHLAANPEAQRLLERLIRQHADGWKSVVNLYPAPLRWKREAPPGVKRLAEELGPQAVLSGVNMVSERLRVQVRRDAVLASILGFVIVALLLWLDYRRLSDTLLSLAPLVVGIVWMLGGMVLLGLSMNFFNIFVTTMIIGIGVDYGIHIMHRFRECGSGSSPAELERGLLETGKAIIMAALSTSVGFGSLSLSHYPGLRSMGLVAIMGALATALVAITLLPAFLGLRLAKGEALDD